MIYVASGSPEMTGLRFIGLDTESMGPTITREHIALRCLKTTII